MYDFDTVVNRRDSGSIKWEVAENELPMWIADMDFLAPPAVRQAIEKRAAHGVFGYAFQTDAWADAYVNWWKERHNLSFSRENLIFCTGVVGAISSIVKKLTTPAEKVLIQTPVYNVFYNSILNSGRVVYESPLDYENGAYSINWERLENDLSDPQVSLMIVCNPHNPIGKIWDADTLAKIGALCNKHHVTVVSDEIHCDLTAPDRLYTPFLAASDLNARIAVACVAPTKTFNLAGLHTSAVIALDPALKHKVWRQINTDEVGEPNAFAMDATVAAFNESGDWLDELRAYVFENRRIVEETLDKAGSGAFAVRGDATYLIWIDCTAVCDDSRKLAAFIREKTGLYLTAGAQYGKGGEAFLRLNVACPRQTLLDGLNRLCEALKNYRA